MNLETQPYSELIGKIGSLLQHGRQQAAQSVNTILVQTYWYIGQHIVEFEQKGSEKAEYGSQLLDNLSKDLSQSYGKGFSRSNLFQIRQFYIKFQNIQTLSGQLAWSHYIEILKSSNDLELGFYAKQCQHERWSVRELKRQMKSSLFERLALSKDKEGVLRLAKEGHIVENAEDLIKDPFVLDFLNIPERYQYLENELEEKIISNLQQFIMEMGKGFAFIGRQYRMNIGGKHFYLDLLFYHRILKCFVLVDLKRGEIDHQDIGQMNLYLNYFKKEEATEGDNEPIGIVLGAHKNHILVEYATDSITNKVLLSKYQLYLPDKKTLQNQLDKLLEE
ncbi:PDDEXK nuclease domain-containing protein [Flavobacterium sp. RS13.1]|uniref:PDDEXK nuclease domain-containing protein n=1 Tax=Flavobacterium sp. RS13.1 TaxID=3400345 RepID=UPI003AAECBA1